MAWLCLYVKLMFATHSSKLSCWHPENCLSISSLLDTEVWNVLFLWSLLILVAERRLMGFPLLQSQCCRKLHARIVSGSVEMVCPQLPPPLCRAAHWVQLPQGSEGSCVCLRALKVKISCECMVWSMPDLIPLSLHVSHKTTFFFNI